MSDKGKKILLAIIIAVLILPLVQQCLNIIKSQPLDGYFQSSPDVTLSLSKWMDGSYQEGKNKYLNDNMSFRPDLIRLNCQMDYSLFNRSNTGWGVIGKNKCLLDLAHIAAYNGGDYVGYDTLLAKLIKLKAIQDTLGRLGKTVVFMHTAAKAFFYPDCIPDNLTIPNRLPTNYSTFLRIADSIGVNQLDCNSWFCAMKDTSRELLYPKQSIHWSYYGAMLAGDSLVKYLEKLRHIQMPQPKWVNVRHTTEPDGSDNDIARAMNLIWPITTETFTYGNILCNDDSTKTKPSAVYIGDSFTITLLGNHFFDCINSRWEFWFYFKQLHKPPNGDAEYTMEHYDWQGAIDKTDCVILVYNPANLNKFGSGFVEAAYAHYFPIK